MSAIIHSKDSSIDILKLMEQNGTFLHKIIIFGIKFNFYWNSTGTMNSKLCKEILMDTI